MRHAAALLGGGNREVAGNQLAAWGPGRRQHGAPRYLRHNGKGRWKMLWLLASKKWDRCKCPTPGCDRWWMHTDQDWPMNVVSLDGGFHFFP